MTEKVSYVIMSYTAKSGLTDRIRLARSPEHAQEIIAMMKRLWPDSPISYRVTTYYDPPFECSEQ